MEIAIQFVEKQLSYLHIYMTDNICIRSFLASHEFSGAELVLWDVT